MALATAKCNKNERARNQIDNEQNQQEQGPTKGQLEAGVQGHPNFRHR